MVKKAVMMCILALLFPYIITLAWTGKIEEQKKVPIMTSGKKIILDRKGGQSYMDVEEYLPGVVAKQMPADYGKEALRAQAIIARTYIYGKMNGQNEIKESGLHMEYLEEKQMEKLWGSESFIASYQAVEDAVRSTAGTVMMYDGKLIDPLFHRASTGKTRAGDENHPYLQSADCSRDVEAEGFLTVAAFSREDFAGKINQISGAVPVTAEQIPESCQIILRDEGGYVGQVQIGTKVYTGEEIQYALGLPSPSYGFEEYEGGVRAVCQGIGHGYGMSQYGARCKAEEGWTAEKILPYFYKNIVLISE
ncbi:SpoIID/LytB domain-containing protein [Clostridium sp. Marseille-P2415]|uniref:SpoIID/LytB domain-containing protein n=1 Tax=Clostridium sp. Marseille-P2415 TaxID=1805471 RepID=UPI00098844F1|nr:SpoIID/LytB domain-containing protein [Clostridium sp. Marseille-P2415]